MIKISDAVREIIYQDIVALQALQQNLLNLSSYADKILKKVEAKGLKDVKKGSVVAALSRVAVDIRRAPQYVPRLVIESIIIKLGLCTVAFRNNAKNIELIRKVKEQCNVAESSFFTVTIGVNEISIVADEEYLDSIVNLFSVKPKSIFTHLVGLTVTVNPKVAANPNMVHTMHSALAVKRINIVEMISARPELTFVIEKKQMKPAIEAFQGFMK